MLSLLSHAAGERFERCPTDGLERLAADQGCLFWLDVEGDAPQDVAVLDQVFHFHPLTIEDSTNDIIDPPKVDDYSSYLFIILQAIDFSVRDETLATTELNLYVTKHAVVTVHKRPLPLIQEVMGRCERGAPHASRGPDWLAHAIIDALVDQILPVVERMDEDIAGLEDQALEKPSAELVERISNVKRSTMRLRWLVAPQREVLNRIARGDFDELIRPETSMYFRDVYDHLVRLDSMVEDLRDLGETVMSIHLATQNNRLNEIMKTLGIVGVVFLPLTLVASVFGTNFDDTYMPSGWLGFGLMCASFVVSAGVMLWVFKRRGWI